jgi:hypothetical protein
MAVESLTDEQIADLLGCPKQVDRANPRSRQDGKHLRRDFDARSVDDRHYFVIFTRQSTVIPESFSAGLRWKSKTGEEVMLLRCNGSDHEHFNAIEGMRFSGTCHVHKATERYAAAGRKVESFALPDTAYRSLNGALHHLAQLANISGLDTQPDTPDLFDDVQ